MADVHSKEIRSFNMSQIKGKNTKPEILVRKFLFANGIRYRLHDKRLPGKPDMVFPKYKKVVFIHGCFWHGHEGCRYYSIPKTRTEWWTAKIKGNTDNDMKAFAGLTEKGWNIFTVWECELKKNQYDITLKQLISQISANLSPAHADDV